MSGFIDQDHRADDIDATLWLQQDANYLYAQASRCRDEHPLANWLAPQIQEAAAASSHYARTIMGIKD